MDWCVQTMSEAADGPTGAEEPPPLPSTAEITENQMEELRSYQQCALQRARERNVIMVGSTGIGTSRGDEHIEPEQIPRPKNGAGDL